MSSIPDDFRVLLCSVPWVSRRGITVKTHEHRRMKLTRGLCSVASRYGVELEEDKYREAVFFGGIRGGVL